MIDIKALQEFSKNDFSGLVGVEYISVDPDCIKAKLKVRKEITTFPGTRLHGGAAMAFADALGAVATFINMPEGKSTTTIESKTNFFKAGQLDQYVYAECVPLHKGRQTMVWQTTISRDDGKKVAMVTQTQMILDNLA